MSICPKWVLQPQKSALRFFIGQYLSSLGGLLHDPKHAGGGSGMDDRDETAPTDRCD